jgi:hypothetical protein
LRAQRPPFGPAAGKSKLVMLVDTDAGNVVTAA